MDAARIKREVLRRAQDDEEGVPVDRPFSRREWSRFGTNHVFQVFIKHSGYQRTCMHGNAPAREELASAREESGQSQQGRRFRRFLARIGIFSRAAAR